MFPVASSSSSSSTAARDGAGKGGGTSGAASGSAGGFLGAFVHSTPLASSPHDPCVCLASNCIREAFGPAVQLVADALQGRGCSSTLRPLAEYMQAKTPPSVRRLGMPPPPASRTGSGTNGGISSGPTDLPSIRASLLVLMQHGIVTVRVKRQQRANKSSSGNNSGSGSNMEYTYHYHPDRARLLQRYSRYMEYVKRAMDATAALLVKTLLLAGRLRTVDAVLLTVERHGDELPKSDRYTQRQTVVDAFCKLVNGGFVEKIRYLAVDDPDYEEGNDDGEAQFEDADEDRDLKPPPAKRVKLQDPVSGSGHSAGTAASPTAAALVEEDPVVVNLLSSHAHYKATLPRDAVWRVRLAMFHDSMRAFHLGRLVAERFGHRVQSAGSLVTAALKYRAHCQHVQAGRDQLAAASSDLTSFSPQDMLKYLPKSVLQLMEKRVGGVPVNLPRAWKELSNMRQPEVVRRVGEDRYEIATTSLADYLRERVVHQVVRDRHGEVAARIVSVLNRQGWLESDTLATLSMIPGKDTRGVLHQLYRSHYVELFHLSASRQYNPGTIVYLWSVQRRRILRRVTENVLTALWNVRLRRQHQVEIGREWIERAQQAADMDENDHETDRMNYEKFCVGLERLDFAAQQLDETLMVLKDY